MRAGKAARVITSIVYTIIFTVLCISGPVHESEETETIFGPARVKLSVGEISCTAESLSGKITRSDIAMLGHFKSLNTADFRGSEYGEEIAAWAEANPQISTLYSVRMPDGGYVDSNAAVLDLTQYSSADVPALVVCMEKLDALEMLMLGDIGGDGFTAEDMQAIRAAAPEARVDFTYYYKGESISPDTKSIDLSTVTKDELDDTAVLLSCLSELETLKLNSGLTLDEAVSLAACAPQAEAEYSFALYGKDVSFAETELDFSHIAIEDEAKQLKKVLPYMNQLKSLDLDSTGLSYDTLESLRVENPDVDIVFRIWFGTNYSVRTDTERILASKPTVGGMIADDTGVRLKYCTKLRFLDLGHNDDLMKADFLAGMPELEALVIAMTGITDISALANCPKLNYLELNSTNIADISALANCTELRDLNIACCPNITDISCLYDIPLDRLWIGSETPVPYEQVAEYKSRHPECKVDTTTVDPHGNAWRYTRYDPEEPKYFWVPRYEQLREEMGYNYQEYSFYWLDPKCGLAAPAEFAGKYGKEVYGL